MGIPSLGQCLLLEYLHLSPRASSGPSGGIVGTWLGQGALGLSHVFWLGYLRLGESVVEAWGSRPHVPGPFLVICDLSLGPGHGYGGEERAVSDNFGSGEWSDRKVRHAFIRKVRYGLGGGWTWAPGAVGLGGTHSHTHVLLGPL